MSGVVIYLIRLKNYPEYYVAKKSKTYALNTDQSLDKRREEDVSIGRIRTREYYLQIDAYWWTKNPKSVGVSTSASSVRGLFTCAVWAEKEPTFSEYEIVRMDATNGSVTVIPATDFYRNWKSYE
jgi:hypothetical protein